MSESESEDEQGTAQGLVEQLMGGENESSDDETSPENVAGLRHLSTTDDSPIDEAAYKNAAASAGSLEQFLFEAASQVWQGTVVGDKLCCTLHPTPPGGKGSTYFLGKKRIQHIDKSAAAALI